MTNHVFMNESTVPWASAYNYNALDLTDCIIFGFSLFRPGTISQLL